MQWILHYNYNIKWNDCDKRWTQAIRFVRLNISTVRVRFYPLSHPTKTNEQTKKNASHNTSLAINSIAIFPRLLREIV